MNITTKLSPQSQFQPSMSSSSSSKRSSANSPGVWNVASSSSVERLEHKNHSLPAQCNCSNWFTYWIPGMLRRYVIHTLSANRMREVVDFRRPDRWTPMRVLVAKTYVATRPTFSFCLWEMYVKKKKTFASVLHEPSQAEQDPSLFWNLISKVDTFWKVRQQLVVKWLYPKHVTTLLTLSRAPPWWLCYTQGAGLWRLFYD